MRLNSKETLDFVEEELSSLPQFQQKVRLCNKPSVSVIEFGEVRGDIYVVDINGQKYVVKGIQGGDNERQVVTTASRIGIGPKLEEMSRGLLAEEFIEGISLEDMNLGNEEKAVLLGGVFGRLHANKIVYNDLSFSRHILITGRRETVIDYGFSHIGEDFHLDLKAIGFKLNDNRAMQRFMEEYRKVKS